MTTLATAPIRRNENYTGPDDQIARSQAEADAWFAELAREHRAGTSTLTAADRLDIIELTHVWDSAYDALDLETWLSVWADDDGVFSSRGFGEFRGRAAMTGYFTTYKTVFNGLRHVLSNHIIVGQGDTARMYCYLTVFQRITGTAMLGTSPFYDQLRRVDGRWKFVRRDQVVDPGMTQTPEGQRLMGMFAQVMGSGT